MGGSVPSAATGRSPDASRLTTRPALDSERGQNRPSRLFFGMPFCLVGFMGASTHGPFRFPSTLLALQSPSLTLDEGAEVGFFPSLPHH